MALPGNGISRRTVLRRCSRLVALAAGSRPLAPLFAGPGSRCFKIGVCDWTLGRCDVSCFELARQVGVEGLQVSMIDARSKLDLRLPEMRKAYREAAGKAGLEIASLNASGAGGPFLRGDPKAAQLLNDSIDVCKALGMTVSMPAFFPHSEGAQKRREMDCVIGVLKEVAPRAQKEGIVFGMENSYNAEDNMRIIDGVGSSAVKVYYDTGNSASAGRDVCKEIRQLGNRICEFHAKDIELHGKTWIGHMLGQGRIDFREVRKAIDDAGYNGWIQVEIEGARPQDLVSGCRADYRYLRSIFPERAESR